MKPLSRPARNCPFPDCPSHNRGHARIVRHGRYKSRHGSRPRLRCRDCSRTFGPRVGTMYHRMRHPPAAFDRAMQLQVDGLPQAAAARAVGTSPGTISRWRSKASAHARRFDEEHLSIREPVEFQLDELRTYGAKDLRETWLYNAIEVWSRVWASSYVGRRTRRSTRLFLVRVREACPLYLRRVLVTSDEFKYYAPELDRAFGPACVYVQVKNRYRRDRILQSRSRLVLGTERQYELARERSEDGTRPNTAYVERLNLLVRRSCSYLQRRTPAPMRKPQLLADAIDLLRCYYNFVRPHGRLKFGKVTRTPAMQAGIFDRALTWREIFSWVPPPKRRGNVLDFTGGRGAWSHQGIHS